MGQGFVIFLCLLCITVCYASHCGHIFENQVSDKEAQFIVDKHNQLRDLISKGEVPGQPQGVNLKPMKYDMSLAANGKKIAELCRFAHHKVSDRRWHHVGQNLYISCSTEANSTSDWSQAIQGWFDEHNDYNYGRCCHSGPKMTGHYTQVVWADTELVGCGYTYYNKTHGFYKYCKLYVCNYGPGGNIVGQLPYKTSNKSG